MLKKFVCILVLTMTATSAFALSVGVNADLGTQGFNRSKGVDFAYESAASGGTGDPDVYAISTKHKQGDKVYGSTSASSYIWFKTGTSGTDLATGDNPSVPDTPSDSAVSNGFSQM